MHAGGSRFKHAHLTPSPTSRGRPGPATGPRWALAAPRRADDECPTAGLFASVFPAASSSYIQASKASDEDLASLGLYAVEVLYIAHVRPQSEHRSKIAVAAEQQSKSHVRPQQAALAI